MEQHAKNGALSPERTFRPRVRPRGRGKPPTDAVFMQVFRAPAGLRLSQAYTGTYA